LLYESGLCRSGRCCGWSRCLHGTQCGEDVIGLGAFAVVRLDVGAVDFAIGVDDVGCSERELGAIF